MERIIGSLIGFLIAAAVVTPMFLVMAHNEPECNHILVEVIPSHTSRNCFIVQNHMIPQHYDWKERKVGEHSQEHDKNDKAVGVPLVCVKCQLLVNQIIVYNHK